MTLRVIFSMFVAAGCALAQAPAVPQVAVLEGKVVSVTGQPLNKVTLHLRAEAVVGVRRASTGPGPSQIFPVTTDPAGNFRFAGVEPGRYMLSAERNGFLQQSYGSRGPMGDGVVFEVAPGAHLTGLTIAMTPQGIISGIVEDADGEPLGGIEVVTLKMGYRSGKRQMHIQVATAVNADGTFVVGPLPPGRYYLSAADLPRSLTASSGYLTTYYPGTPESSAATPIEVAAGAVIRGMEIRLVKGRMYAVRGKITGLTAQAGVIRLVLLRTDGSPQFYGGAQETMVGREGTFVFPDVPAGGYEIQTTGNGFLQLATMLARTPVTIADRDVEDVIVPLTLPITVTGTIRMEGDSPPSETAASLPQQIFLLRKPGNSGSRGLVKSDGTLEVTGVTPDKFRVVFSNLPPGAYVKRVQFAGADITHGEVDLTSGSNGPLEILLSPKAAAVSGVVRNETGDALPNVTVTAWSASHTENGTPRSVSTDARGAFEIGNLVPGEYRVAAWEDIDIGAAENLDFLAAFESSAVKIMAAESSRVTADAIAISRDAIEAAVATLP